MPWGSLPHPRTFLISFLISLSLFGADFGGVLNYPKSIVSTVTVPVQFGLYKTSQAFFKQFEFIFLARRAVQEKTALTEQLATVLSENADLKRKLAETQGFLVEQQALDPLTYKTVPARPLSLTRYLTIDRGQTDGILINQPVVYKDVYLGQIRDLSAKTARVLLSTDPDSKIEVFASNQQGKARGILVGQYGSDMLMDKILHQEPIAVGDLIYSEGTENLLPRGLILGQVSSVLDRQNEVFKQAVIKPIFDVSSLDIVFVITN